MPSVKRIPMGKRKIGCFEKKHGIPPEAVRKSQKPKPARSDMYLGIKPSAPRCSTCASQVEFINLYYKAHPKEKNAGVQGEAVVNSKMFCPKCGGIPRRKAVRSDSVGRKGTLKKTPIKRWYLEEFGYHKLKVVRGKANGDKPKKSASHKRFFGPWSTKEQASSLVQRGSDFAWGKPCRSDAKTSAKFVHEIEAKDIGKGFVHCDKRPTDRKPKVINMRDLMGRAQRRDIGKRIYRVGSIYQVENDEQLAKRKRK